MKLLSNWNEKRKVILRFDKEALAKDLQTSIEKYLSGNNKLSQKEYEETLHPEILDLYIKHCGFTEVSESHRLNSKVSMSGSHFPLDAKKIEWLVDLALTIATWAQDELDKIDNIRESLENCDLKEPEQVKMALLSIIDEFNDQDYDSRWFGPISDAISTVFVLSGIDFFDFDIDDVLDRTYQSWVTPEPIDHERVVKELEIEMTKSLFNKKYD